MASAVLKRFEDDGRPAADLPLVRWALEDSLGIIEHRLDGILRNFPVRGVGRRCCGPSCCRSAAATAAPPTGSATRWPGSCSAPPRRVIA
jgi:hypothetical protein